LRPELYNILSGEAKKTLFIKAHDAYTFLPDQRPMFPPSATKGVIYIIRNPLDVAVSYANHNGCTLQKSIDMMGEETHGLCIKNKRLVNQLRQKMGTWSNHVMSWTTAQEQRVQVVRYEDMKQSPVETFTAASTFSGLEFGSQAIEEAIKNSSFEVLKKQEQENGFKEKSAKSPSFFRQGKTGSWREHLTGKQVKQIIRDQREMMQKFGYLTADGEIVH